MSGRVVEGGSSKPIVGATVKLPRLSQSLTTDSEGKFVVDNVKTGKFNIIVEAGVFSLFNVFLKV